MSIDTKIRNDRHIRLFGFIIPHLPGLIFRLGGTLLRFKGQANKAGRIFRKELINQGFDKKTADNLTEIYLAGSDFSSYIRKLS
jgi:hypothetical protein